MAEMPILRARIPKPDLEKLEEIAQKRGIKVPELVRRLLSKALIEKLDEQV